MLRGNPQSGTSHDPSYDQYTECRNQPGPKKQFSAHGRFHSINPSPCAGTLGPHAGGAVSLRRAKNDSSSSGNGDSNCTTLPVMGCVNCNSAECRKFRPNSSTSRAAYRVVLSGSATIFAGAPYSVSPTTGWLIEAICTRIWCVRPVSIRTRACVNGPNRVSNRSTTR